MYPYYADSLYSLTMIFIAIQVNRLFQLIFLGRTFSFDKHQINHDFTTAHPFQACGQFKIERSAHSSILTLFLQRIEKAFSVKLVWLAASH